MLIQASVLGCYKNTNLLFVFKEAKKYNLDFN